MTDPRDERDPAELLPWYVNGTLADDERHRVEAHLEGSPGARDEVAAWRTLGDAIRAQQPVEAPAELGWRRLRREIRAQARAEAPAPPRATPWRLAFGAAAALLITVQAGLLWQAHRGDPGVELLGGGSPGVEAPAVEGALDLQLRFRDDAAWQQVAALFGSVDARVLRGPSALGVVEIRLVPAPGAHDAQARLAQLRASPLVEHVQLLPRD